MLGRDGSRIKLSVSATYSNVFVVLEEQLNCLILIYFLLYLL